jgi:hypothetical protein
LTTQGAGTPPARSVGAFLGLEASLLLLAALTLTAWFGGWPEGVPARVPALILVLAAAVRLAARRPALARPPWETLLCLALATAYRLPALLHPWAWVNRDGAYGAFVALHILQGERPAPAFTEGANYQGTLKSHLAALAARLFGADDLSFLMTLASLLLYLVFVAATMALARRIAGPIAALVAGVYLAVSPRFLTVFSLNCVGQYVDVVALGGAALAVVARILDRRLDGASARGHYLAVGILLGAAFWAQPVALGYVLAALLVLALRARTWRDPWMLVLGIGLVLGALPVLIWNVQNDWATGDILGRDPDELRAQVEALPQLVRKTFAVSFPILAGASPFHPLAPVPSFRIVVGAVPPVLLVAFLLVKGRDILTSIRRRESTAALLPVVLTATCLALFWAVAAGSVYSRPRYLLPLTAAMAVHLGTAVAWLWRRVPLVTSLIAALLLAVNLVGTLPRLLESRAVAERYQRLVEALDSKGIRNGYADFSISAPVTMFTAERIVLSARLGPTPAYESEPHARRVDEAGPDAYVLLPDDDPERFASVLRGLGVTFQMEREPVPFFYGFSRRVRLEEVAGFRGEAPPTPTTPE